MRFQTFHQPPHQLGGHFHSRRVPHVAPRPIAFTPPRGRRILQMWSTVGCVWPPLIRLLMGRPAETTRDPSRNLRGSHLSGCRRSCEGKPVAPRFEHCGASDRPAQNRGHCERSSFLGWQASSWIDTTVVSALSGRGVARGRWDGQAVHEAQNDKRRRYHELVDGGRCHLS